MKVKRIVANVEVLTPAAAKRFYQDVLGLSVVRVFETMGQLN